MLNLRIYPKILLYQSVGLHFKLLKFENTILTVLMMSFINQVLRV